MKFPQPPSASELATPDFAEFKGIAEAYFSQVDPYEFNNSLTYRDLEAGVWRPFGFLAIHALPAAERNDRQLRAHVWQEIKPGRESSILPEHPHRHGAHLGGLLTLNTLAEQMVTATRVGRDTDHTHTLHERDGNQWRAGTGVQITIQPTDVYSDGMRHYVPADGFHKTVNQPRKTGVTLVLRGKVFCSEGAIHPAHLPSMPQFPEAQPLSPHALNRLWEGLVQARRYA